MKFIKDFNLIVVGVLLMLYVITGWQWLFMIVGGVYIAFSIIRYKDNPNFWFIFLGVLGVLLAVATIVTMI